jgi:phosphatidate cytidylyltransferase
VAERGARPVAASARPPAPERRPARPPAPGPAPGRQVRPEPRASDERRLLGGGIDDYDPRLDDYDRRVEEYDPRYERYEEDGPPGRSFSLSLIVGVALAAVVFVTLYFGPVPTVVLVGVLTLLAVMELFNAMRVAGLRPATLLGLVGATALPVAAFVRGDAAYPLVVGLAVVFGMLWYLTGADTERPVLNLGLTLTGVLWVGGLAGFAALMVRAEDGVGLLLATIVITATSDSLAYIGGRAYGTKPFHDASPNKTWEGTMTGFSGALLAGLAIGVTGLIDVFDGQFVSVMVMAAVVGVLAAVGDLAESLVKRDLGIKDMGTLLPGHGGVLDRVDGLLFALPGAYYVAVFYQLI